MTVPTEERTAQGRAKLLVFGEHAAVWGYPAVGRGLNWTLEARWTPALDRCWSFPGTPLYQVPGLKILVDRLTALAQARGQAPLSPGQLTLSSTIPPGSGFGSSAALCAALVRLFFPGENWTGWETLAREAEKTFHGNPSGIDTGLALRDGWAVLYPQKDQCPRFEALSPPPLALVCGTFPRSSNTKSLVVGLGEKMRSGDPRVRQTMARLGETAREAAALLTDSSRTNSPHFPQETARLMRSAQDLLTVLGLADPAQDKLFAWAQEQTGALAGKLSGAGAGGAYILLYPDDATARAALPRLQEQTARCPLPATLVDPAPLKELP